MHPAGVAAAAVDDGRADACDLCGRGGARRHVREGDDQRLVVRPRALHPVVAEGEGGLEPEDGEERGGVDRGIGRHAAAVGGDVKGDGEGVAVAEDRVEVVGVGGRV